MKVIVIGAVAGGTTAATKARRNDKNAEITIYEKDTYISYVACGLPYFISGRLHNLEPIVPRDAAFFKQRHNIDVLTKHEVLTISPGTKEVTVKNLHTNRVFTDRYDKLLIATGASPFIPPVNGVDSAHVFSLRTINDALKIKTFIEDKKPKRAVIVGSGFIGMELLQSFSELGISVSLVESRGQIISNLDTDMAKYLETYLLAKNIHIEKNAKIATIAADRVILDNGGTLEADMVIMATGIRPNTALAAAAGVATGISGAIKVDKHMRTNLTDIYACGDCIETFSAITGMPNYQPLGSTANKTGRIAGDTITGGNLEYSGNLGTAIVQVFELAVASTGMSEQQAAANFVSYVVSKDTKPDKPDYFDGKDMQIKVIADQNSSKILGAQVLGYDGVDKRIDVFAALISYGAKASELPNLDLAYSPPFSTAKDPVHYAGMILEKIIQKTADTK